jgi:hypothetical protein
MITKQETALSMFSNQLGGKQGQLLSDQMMGGSSCEDLYQSVDEPSEERKIIYHKINQDGKTTILEEPSNDDIINL